MRNLMSLAYGNAVLNADVKIDIKIEPHFAHTAFLNLDDSGHRSRCVANRPDNFTARRRVHYLVQRGSQKPNAISGDDGAGEKRRPIIRALPTTAADQGDGDADECGGGRKGIAAMMPGISLHGRAFDMAPNAVDVTEQNFFYPNHDDQYSER